MRVNSYWQKNKRDAKKEILDLSRESHPQEKFRHRTFLWWLTSPAIIERDNKEADLTLCNLDRS